MMEIRYHNKFKKDLKTLKKRKKNLELLKEVITMLAEEKVLPEKYREHDLIGEFNGYKDCHIQNDWVLIYKIDKTISLISLYRTGTHSDIFDK